MKNIFVYIGSRNKDSRLFRYTYQIIDFVRNHCNAVGNIDIYSPLNCNLHPSTGCKNCFQKGFCPNEESPSDDGELIKTKIEQADIVILASPVYSHNVSSDMKVLIDRLSYWAHIFKLAGKSGVIVTTAESNGAQFVADYLTKIMTYMGASIEHIVNFVNSEQDLAELYAEEAAHKIIEICDDSYHVTPTSQQELTFQTLKLILLDYPRDHFEYRYWKDHGLFDCQSYEELVDKYVKV
ncbi:flavodoxin family protein [Paenibacillus thiaminolyticus]|uniref:flavodoxin family protein n=1 Tax=Paenibacillus thiaminolyticus TaxID=49283 RepID=UPI001162F98F|nr:flavodoxin family protein [Paenibacillus thiaminolyticus]NGP58719.1 flavodoxin family protein [Paenibacillus thiaminolyticus]WCR26255.1 flavodoxin family protein [Paenibacillus thiaminolyticus]